MEQRDNAGIEDHPELQAISYDEVRRHIQVIVSRSIPLFRKNIEGVMVPIPASRLEQYLGESAPDTVFYILQGWEQYGKEADSAASVSRQASAGAPSREGPMSRLEQYGATFEQVEKFQNLSIVEREEGLDHSIEDLHRMKGEGQALDLSAVVKMVEIIANTFYANYASLEDNLSTENVKNNLQGLYNKTEWIIRLVIELFQGESFRYADYPVINRIETGSLTLDKMCRGLLWFIGFILFFNEYVDTGLVTRQLRMKLRDVYQRYYKRRMPDAGISLETIVRGGLRRVDPDKELVPYALGGLLYDIGKIPFIAYHDSNDEFDENMVKVHVLIGYNMVLKAKKYPFAVVAMTAFHHEYYGGRSGYRFTNPIISKLLQKKRTEEDASYFLTYDEKEFIGGKALAYFPCKIVEIIDVYNALSSRKRMDTFEALNVMKKEFITNSLKIDPLLFEIFLEFLSRCGLLEKGARDKIDSLIY